MSLRARLAFLAASACLLGLVVGWLATYSAPGRWLDAAALRGFVGLHRPRTALPAYLVAHLADPLPFAVAGMLLVAVAFARRRVALAVGTGFVLLAANVTTQALKVLLPDDRSAASIAVGAHVARGAWPSGHATAAMALALGLVMVVGPRFRPAAAVAGAAFAAAVSFALLALGWHFPSDVLAGYCVAALWTALAVGVLWTVEDRWPSTRARPAQRLGWSNALGPPLTAGVACAGFAALLVLTHPDRTAAYVRAHTTFVAGALVIAATAAAISLVLAVVLRR